MAGSEGDGRRATLAGAALLGDRDGDALGTVRRLFGRLRQFVLEVAAARLVMVPVLVVERLQREAAVRLLAAAASLRYVRVVLPHRLRLVHLQLRVQLAKLRLQHARGVHADVHTSVTSHGVRRPGGRGTKI